MSEHDDKRPIVLSPVDPAGRGWHVDRRIPVALIVSVIVTLLTQTAIAVMWAAKMDQRMTTLEERFDRRDGFTRSLEDASNSVTRAVAVLTAQVEALQENQSDLRTVTNDLTRQAERATVQLQHFNETIADLRRRAQ